MKYFRWLACCLLSIFTALTFAAAEPPASDPTVATADVAKPSLQPYQARYHTTAMGLGLTLKRSLVLENGIYTLKNAGKIFVAGISEKTHFRVNNGAIHGIDFVYKLTGLLKRRREVQFDPEQHVIRSLKKKVWTEHPWQPNLLDRLSQQEAVRLALINAATPPALLTFTVVDGARIRTRKLEWIGNEKLATEVGELDTVHYRQIRENTEKRASDIWLATDFDYLMVRTRHVENGSPVEITLIDADINGNAVLGRTW